MVKYYRALAKATPRVRVETIGRSDEGRELVVVWVSSAENLAHLAQNRANLAKLADPRGLSEAQIHELIATTKPDYHLMGGLHSRRDGAVGDAHGTRLSVGHGDVAADRRRSATT